MSTGALMIIEIMLFSGVALIWAIREYLSVRPEKTDGATSDQTRHPEG